MSQRSLLEKIEKSPKKRAEPRLPSHDVVEAWKDVAMMHDSSRGSFEKPSNIPGRVGPERCGANWRRSGSGSQLTNGIKRNTYPPTEIDTVRFE